MSKLVLTIFGYVIVLMLEGGLIGYTSLRETNIQTALFAAGVVGLASTIACGVWHLFMIHRSLSFSRGE